MLSMWSMILSMWSMIADTKWRAESADAAFVIASSRSWSCCSAYGV